MNALLDQLRSAQNLTESAYSNITAYLNAKNLPQRIHQSIVDLIEKNELEELNLRFDQNISFGTGGIRGRTISKVITSSETGKATKGETPEYPAVGTSCFNEINLLKATKALFDFTASSIARKSILDIPRVAIAGDVRHFSADFSKLVAKTWQKLGGYSMLFDGPRPTPLLSYTIRRRKAHAGVVITASHNPYHDNGFKAYFCDGSQLSGEATLEISKYFESYKLEEIIDLLESLNEQMEPVYFNEEDDIAYNTVLEEAVLDPEIISANSPKIIFTPIHGTGSIATVPALWNIGANVKILEKQNNFDPNFTTVASPNPENKEAFEMGISFARRNNFEAIYATDPDCDRLGVSIKHEGDFVCLTGNQIASMLAKYRLETLKRFQFLKPETASKFTVLKTFVTTGLVEKIARSYGACCVNTHTGFKWMAKKMGSYEKEATIAISDKEGIAIDFDNTDRFARLEVLSRYSKYTVMAAEESYGYLTLDVVRDKDASAAALSITEMFSFLKSKKIHPMEFLDNLYMDHGYHVEKTENIYFDDHNGVKKIQNIMDSYRKMAPQKLKDLTVTNIKDFSVSGLLDEEEEELSQENFLMISLENQFRVAVRPSGTEPKIKFYIFGESQPNSTNLVKTKEQVTSIADELGAYLVEDAKERAN